MSLWWAVIGMGIVTFLARISFIVLPPDTRIPEMLQRSLRYVAAAVLPALVMPDVLFRGVSGGFPFDAYRLVAAIVAALVAWKTRSIMATIGVGMAVLLGLRWLMPA
jgi:branched-subunit amino acid transport protein